MHVQSVRLRVWGSALLHGSGPQLARPARLCGQLLQQSFHSSAGAFVFFQRWNQAFESSFDFVYNFLVTALKKARQRKRFDKIKCHQSAEPTTPPYGQRNQAIVQSSPAAIYIQCFTLIFLNSLDEGPAR